MIVSGDSQNVAANAEAPQPLTVRVNDAAGNPIEGQLVVFRVTAGGGSMYAGASITDAEGIARDRWTVGGVVGSAQRVEARAVDNATGQRQLFGTFHARVVPGAAARIELDSAAATLTGVVGYAINVPVRILDSLQNRAPGAVVHWSVVAGGGRVAKTTSVADSNGVAWMLWAMGNAAGLNQLRAALDSSRSVVISATAAPRSPIRAELALDSVFIDALGVSVLPYLNLTGIDNLGNRFPLEGAVPTVLDPARINAGFNTSTNGRARVVVRSGRLEDTLIVGIRQVATVVSISTGSRWGVYVGEPCRPVINLRDRNGREIVDGDEVYTSSNPTVASVDADGYIHGHVPGGTFTVTVTANGRSATTRELTVIQR